MIVDLSRFLFIKVSPFLDLKTEFLLIYQTTMIFFKKSCSFIFVNYHFKRNSNHSTVERRTVEGMSQFRL
jgi:hypothetical protein